MIENSYNLTLEKWIPTNHGRLSLLEIFENPSELNRQLEGNAVEKMAILKLLLAIVHAAFPKDNDPKKNYLGSCASWSKLETKDFCEIVRDYLIENSDYFFLYGEKPFLQVPLLKELVDLSNSATEGQKENDSSNTKKKKDSDKIQMKRIGRAIYPDLVLENNSVLTHYHIQQKVHLADHEKAIFLLTLMNFALGGKRVIDVKNLGLEKGYAGRKSTAKSGPSLRGNPLHSYWVGDDILTTLRINALTHEQIESQASHWSQGVGQPLWEILAKYSEKNSPAGFCQLIEEVDESVLESYIGRLLAVSRFVLLEQSSDNIYYSEGSRVLNDKDDKPWYEPSLTIIETKNNKKTLVKASLAKESWRELPSLLAFLNKRNNALKAPNCFQLSACHEHLARFCPVRVGLWTGGLKASGTSGDQKIKTQDDFVESLSWFPTSELDEGSLDKLTTLIDFLEKSAGKIFFNVKNYFEELGCDGKTLSKKAQEFFWSSCSQSSNRLIDLCFQKDESKNEELKQLQYVFKEIALQAFDFACSNAGPKQFIAWIRERNFLGIIIQQSM